MSADEYELLPHEELQKLREEVEELKKNPMGNVEESEDLKTAMAKLTKGIYQLIDILTQTNDEMEHEFRRTSISKHFQKISEQNESIAQALLGMAQLQENVHSEPPTQPPVQEEPPQALGADNFAGAMGNTPPPVDIPPQQNTNPLDLPPPEHKKKGLSGMFK